MKAQLQKLIDSERFTKEKVEEITSLMEIAALFDSSSNKLGCENLGAVVKACYKEIYEDRENYNPVFEQTTLNTYFLFYVLNIDEVLIRTLITLLDSSNVKYCMWMRKFIQDTNEEIRDYYNFFLEMFKKYRDYHSDFSQMINYFNTYSEILENKEYLESFIEKFDIK